MKTHIKTLRPGRVKYRKETGEIELLTDRIEIHTDWVKVCGEDGDPPVWIPREKVGSVTEV